MKSAFVRFLREEKGVVQLSALAEQKNCILDWIKLSRLILGIGKILLRLFSAWWKVNNRVETFDWDTWYK